MNNLRAHSIFFPHFTSLRVKWNPLTSAKCIAT
jgi:hypothetical protein